MQVHSIPGFHEPFSAMSHLGGALVFAVLGVFLLRRGRGDGRRILLLGVFAFTSVLLLSMSGVFHMLPEPSSRRAVLERLDHAAIFALIAGTHTPVQGLFFRGLARWGVLTFMWLVAATGITLFTIFHDSLPRGLGTTVFLMMGWTAGIAGFVVWRRYGTARVRLLVLGGVVYSIGAILLGMEWPTLVEGLIGPHEVWHVAVLVAMGMHWRVMFRHAAIPLDGPVVLPAT
jgi:channel protein (hemolysin III family)